MPNLDTTTGNTAVLSPEQTAVLQRARASSAKPQAVRVPELRLFNTMMKVPGVTRGEYFTQRYNPETKENDITAVGPNPQVVILHRAYSYSFFDEQLNRLVAWTSEFTFTDPDTIYLFHNDGQRAAIEKQGSFREIKQYMGQRYSIEKEGSTRSLMKFTNILYVLLDGKVYRMFVSNASAAGVEGEDANPDFKNPQEGSLIKFWEEAGCDFNRAPFESVCELGSRYIDGKRQYYLMTFKREGDVADLGAMCDTYSKLMHDLSLLQRMDVERMGVAAVKQEASAGPTAAEVVYASEINPDDLPF